MSRRFGRNQKRRMREALLQAGTQVANLREAHKLSEGLLRHQGHKIQALRDEIENAKEMVVRSSALFNERETIKHPGMPGDHVVVAPEQRFEYVSDSSSLEEMTFQQIPLDVLIADVDRNFLDRAVHFEVSFNRDPDRTVRYAMSQGAMAAMSRERLFQVLHENIAKQMAHLLTGLLKP